MTDIGTNWSGPEFRNTAVGRPLNPLCDSWCFVLGPALRAFCSEPRGHEGEHRTTVSVYVEPRSEFTVTWHLVRDTP